MKILLGLFLVFVFVVDSFGSPLVFKATKELKNSDVTELLTFDTARYKQVRIGIKAINRKDVLSKIIVPSFLEIAKRWLKQ